MIDFSLFSFWPMVSARKLEFAILPTIEILGIGGVRGSIMFRWGFWSTGLGWSYGE